MEQFKGNIEIRLCNEGSRAEGRYAYLCGEEREWQLTREEGMPFDDPYYEAWEGHTVEVTGRESGDYLIVESIADVEEQ